MKRFFQVVSMALCLGSLCVSCAAESYDVLVLNNMDEYVSVNGNPIKPNSDYEFIVYGDISVGDTVILEDCLLDCVNVITIAINGDVYLDYANVEEN